MEKVLVCGFCTEDSINGKSYFGGAAGGIALNLAGEKISVGILSVLGEDSFSKTYLTELEKRGIDLSLLNQTAQHLPLLTVISQENTEKSRTFDDFGCKNILASIQPPKDLLAKFQILHVVNTPRKLCDYLAVNFAGEISYCPGSFLMRDPDTLSLQLLQKTKYLFCNEEEHSQLEKQVNLQELFSHQLELLCLTKGEKGITIFTKTQTIDLPTVPVRTVVDTTGAGDAIVVGFLAALSQEKSPVEGIKNGQELAAKIIQKHGVVLSE